MHLTHGAAGTDKDCRTIVAQITTIAILAIGVGDIAAGIADEGNIVIVQATDIGFDQTVERFGTDHIQGAAACHQFGHLRDLHGRTRRQHHDIVEATVAKFACQRGVVIDGKAIAYYDAATVIGGQGGNTGGYIGQDQGRRGLQSVTEGIVLGCTRLTDQPHGAAGLRQQTAPLCIGGEDTTPRLEQGGIA